VLGEYRSSDPAVIAQHISWASRYGIDFFTLDWWPSKPERQATLDAFVASPLIEDIKFCIFYETWDLGFDQTFGATTVDEQFAAKFIPDVKRLAERYFRHPRYLRLGERPVIFFYLTRTLVGDYPQLFNRLREELKEFDPIFIGDEIFWFGIDQPRGESQPPQMIREPLPQRIALFDAITAYNFYESTDQTHAGYAKDSQFLPDIEALLLKFRSVGQRPIVPSVIPGYNDRGVRPKLEHYPVPRQFAENAAPDSLLEQMLQRVALPNVDPRLPMVLITSWNEWNEDTAIEPLMAAPATNLDRSKTGSRYSAGYAYEGHDERYLQRLQQTLIAHHGRLLDEKGAPLARVKVELVQDKLVRARTSTDAAGYYNFSRLQLKAGVYELRSLGQAPRTITLE